MSKNYSSSESFLIHVFFETPSLSSAQEILSSLQQCSLATHRDTPCTPSYFFFLSHLDSLSSSPVVLEFIEVYLDGKSFWEHSAAEDFKQSFVPLMNPELRTKLPHCIRIGSPPSDVAEKVLKPILHENIFPLPSGCFVWKKPSPGKLSSSVCLSLEVGLSPQSFQTLEEIVSAVPKTFVEKSTSFVAFVHPNNLMKVRIIFIFPSLPPVSEISQLFTTLHPSGSQLITNKVGDNVENMEEIKKALKEANLKDTIVIESKDKAGYVLHESAAELQEK